MLGFPTFLCLRPPWHQMRPPTGTNVPKSTLLWDLSRPPRGTRPPGWEPLVYCMELTSIGIWLGWTLRATCFLATCPSRLSATIVQDPVSFISAEAIRRDPSNSLEIRSEYSTFSSSNCHLQEQLKLKDTSKTKKLPFPLINSSWSLDHLIRDIC